MSTKMVALALMFPVVLIAAKRTNAQSPTSLSSATISSSEASASSDSQDQPRAEDPGVQTANRNTGAGVVSLSAANGSLQFFQNGLARFRAVETVSRSAHVGLGPRFNSTSCASCHSQPAAGGSGGAVNPQFAFTNGEQPRVAPDDDTPYFITANGPTREARFPFFFDSDGLVDTDAPDGGVEDLFTVSGR